VRIHVIVAMVSERILSEDMLTPYEQPGVTLTYSVVTIGTPSVRHHLDHVLVAPGVVEQAVKAEANGADAIVIDCLIEPGIDACKEVVKIPVVGIGQVAFHTAAMLGTRCSVVTTGKTNVPLLERFIRAHGFNAQCVNVRTINVHQDSDYELDKVYECLQEHIISSIEQDRADVVILGSGRLVGYQERLMQRLASHNYEGVVLIEPLPLGIHYAHTLVAAGLSTSRIAYPSPEAKVVHGYKHFSALKDMGSV
jgi:allantoin racemase